MHIDRVKSASVIVTLQYLLTAQVIKTVDKDEDIRVDNDLVDYLLKAI